MPPRSPVPSGRRWPSLALAAAALVWATFPGVGAARAGSIEDQPQPDGTTRTVIHVTVYKLPDPSAVSPVTQAPLAAVREFIRRFPETFAQKYAARYKADPQKYGKHNWDKVELSLSQFRGIEVERVETDLLAIAGGVAPDVLYVNFRKSDNYIRNGFLYPLDKPEDGYVSDMTQAEKDARIHPKIWPVIYRRGPADLANPTAGMGGPKHVWAIPFGGAIGRVLHYRKDRFDALGLKYPDASWTWDDLFNAAKAASDPRNGYYGLALGTGGESAWYFVNFVWSAGGEIMEYDEATDDWHCTYDSEAAAKALDFFTRIKTEPWVDKYGVKRRGYTLGGNSEWEGMLANGQIAMTFGSADDRALVWVNPEVTGFAPVPLGPPDKDGRRIRAAELNSTMMGLFSQIAEPAVRDAAWEYIRYYDSDEAMTIKTRIMVESGMGQYVRPAHLMKYGFPELVRLAPKGWAELYDLTIASGRPEPYGRNSNFTYNQLVFPLREAEQLALDGKLPTDETKRLAVLRDVLHRSVVVSNEQMMGIVPARDRLVRRVAAVGMLVLIVGAFALAFRRIVRAFTPPVAAMEGVAARRGGWGLRRYFWAYVILIPAVLTILLWRYLPLAWGSTMAFQDYHILGKSRWVWLDNFGDLLFDARWWAAVWNSIRYSLLVIALTVLPPIGLAILLQEVPRGKLLFRLIYYLPAVVSGLVVILLWKQFYEKSENGVANALLMNVPAVVYVLVGVGLLALCLVFARRLFFHESRLPGVLFVLAGLILLFTCVSLASPILFPNGESWGESLTHLFGRLFPYSRETWNQAFLPEAYNWLENENTALVACVIPMVWAGMGPGCLIYLAALKGIADDFYEAGDIDGATFTDKIMFIVFPILKPLLIINFVGVFIGSWNAEGDILAMTGGGADTEVSGLHIFFEAFTLLKFGPATAMAWTLAVMLIGFTMYQLRILSRLEFRTTGEKT